MADSYLFTSNQFQKDIQIRHLTNSDNILDAILEQDPNARVVLKHYVTLD